MVTRIKITLVLAALILIPTTAALYLTTIGHTPELSSIPEGESVIYEGTFWLSFLAPSSGADIVQQVFYLERDGQDYRLILGEVGLPRFTNGTRVMVKGTLVVPSSWDNSTHSFIGDIYVKSIEKV